ncbi:FAD-dependent oxidoreductase [Chloroflexota bacterium]
MERTGIFLCHCKLSPLQPAATEQVLSVIDGYPGVVYVGGCQDMCLHPGLKQVKSVVVERKLDGAVLTSCSPSLHSSVFRQAMVSVGLDAHQVEVVDLKQGQAWTSAINGGISVEEVLKLIKDSVDRLRLDRLFTTIRVPVTKRALVIGGGVAGIQAALDIADGGYEVILAEKTPSIGGHVLQYSEVFPTLDCPQCIMTPKMVEIAHHPNIRLLTYSEVEAVSGEMGNFKVKIKRKTPYVDWDKCTGCGECTNVCPVEIESEFERGVAPQKAINKSFAQAVPNKVVIYKKGMSPCRHACPAGVNAHGYVALISQGKFQEALSLIKEGIPFPSICSRVCHHPCEQECNRGDFDEPIAIRALKRCAAEYGAQEELSPSADKQPLLEEEKRDKKIAIVGAGPAGLTAANELARLGYPVTVFEALPVAGGMLYVGIPRYRLPKESLEAEINSIRRLGVEIKTDTSIGKDLTLDDLSQQGYKAIFIATGAHKSQELGITGENSEGVIYGVNLLRDLNLGKEVKIGRKIGVIGGGNVAIDAARCAVRLGSEVRIFYRRSREEMPATEEERQAAEAEGIKIEYLTTPTEILTQKGKVVGMRCIRMELGTPDASGRRRPLPIPGSEFNVDVDTVIVAIGQVPDLSFLTEDSGIKTVPGEVLLVDSVTLATAKKGVFGGGDAQTGPATAIQAIATGKRAAVSIDRYMKGEDLSYGREERDLKIVETPGRIPLTTKTRQPVPMLPPEERVKSFDEVELTLGEEAAVEEAKRCLACGSCSECFSCLKSCEVQAIDHQMGDGYEEIEAGAIIVATGFELLPKQEIQEYTEDPDIIDGIQFERMLSPGGPTAGVVVKPSDGKIPKEVVFVSCVGSRDPEHGVPYCSRVCCMYLVKQSMLYKHAVPDGQAYIFYIDIRATGKGYEEFVQRAVEEGVLYLRGKVSRIFRDGDKLSVWGVDTLVGKNIEISADLVVLGMAMIPSPGVKVLAQKLGILTDEHGFIAEAHPKLCPLEASVPGIYLAGTAQGPKDIPDSVTQASGAAGKVLSLFSQDELVEEKVVVG